MDWAYRIIHDRRRYRQRERRRSLTWLGLGCSTFLVLGLSIFLISAVFFYAQITHALPALEILPLSLEPPDGYLLQPTQLFDRTGSHIIHTLSNPAAEGSRYLVYDQLPEHVLQAILASVDPSYWENPGFAWTGLAQGTHPTLVQRLVSQFLLKNEEPGLRRNLRERLLAAQVLQKFGREKILEWYLNTLEFGNLVYGIDAASHVYFGKSASDLDLAEASTLAVLAQDPEVNPFLSQETLVDKRNLVLQAMLVQGWVNAEQIFQAGQAKLVFQPPVEQSNPSSDFIELVFTQLETQISYAVLARGGFRIITTLDYELQLQSVCASEAIINRLSAQPIENTTPDGAPCSAARLISTPAETAKEPFMVQAAVVVLDPQNGQVLSLVSKSPGERQVSPSLKHEAGTLLTPFFALSAFTRGFSPSSLLWDLPSAANDNTSGVLLEPSEYRGPVSLRAAIANDYLAAITQVVNQVGKDSVLRTIRQFGFDSDSQITLLEAAQAFGILANQGIRSGITLQSPGVGNEQDLQPASVLRIEDSQGKVWLDWSSPENQSILSTQLAYLINHVLSDESVRWASLGHPNPLEIGRPVAAKIGKISSLSNEWTVGYTPQRVIGVWMGQSSETGSALPERISASLWHALMQIAMSNLPLEDWPVPAGIKTSKVCQPSGLLPTDLCPAIAVDVFIAGNEPNQFDNLYQEYQINRETGNLATVFTPPELVEEHVFLSLPAEAVTWAQATGLDVPPSTYDVIYSPPEPSPTVQISNPALFEHVGGQITFKGSAAGEDFQSYRLQVGKGLNPREWFQIGSSSERPVTDGTLAVWDTLDSSGLYSVQLLVVRKDQRVDRFVTQITVDNQPPQVSVVNPTEGKVISRSKTKSILFQIEASDDLELAQVRFSMDGIFIASLSQPPYALPWQIPAAGEHELLAEAIDLAGNKSQETITFVVK